MGFGNKNTVRSVGVSGVVGSGKSIMCEYLQSRHGFSWIHADAIVHELYKAGQPGYQRVKSEFGESYVNENEVIRPKLRAFVLQDKARIDRLNELIHPLVFDEVNKKIVQLKSEGGEKFCIESFYFDTQNLRKLVDLLVVVDAPTDAIRKRIQQRNIPLEEFDTLLTLQRLTVPMHDILIENQYGLDHFYAQIEKVLQ